ncbi:SpoIID/LytB domain-containing protein [Nocardioides flavescens]|uniref:SpoIID/LytB domain-containing protein n=1 Tax=Nocardioides flavescens TaxID=2691959 RepID=A0A6L7EYL6_9ACTN|nr:SpoIID/LytB domain-containing protein [Nocardioides flavescens]MXG89515.1 SpoIID/LytB domain-containing protein [Nocardioides flavescens]
MRTSWLARTASGAALTLALVGLTGVPSYAEDVPVGAGATTLTLSGHGYGHGRGMSQYGAKGAAAQGLGWAQIVGFYYPGTQLGEARGPIRVQLTAATKRSLTVDARAGLRLQRLAGGRGYRLDRLRPAATRWKLVAHGERTRVRFETSGRWRTLRTVRGPAQVSAGGEPVTLRLPDGAAAAYRGALRAVAGPSGPVTLNVLPLETYLRGVVPAEVPATWPAAAVQAQAVAARTYAAWERAAATGAVADTCDTTSCQVYRGVAAEHPAADAAVSATRRQVVTYQGAPAFTQFSSSNGGFSAAGSAPYLVAQADPYESSSANPNASWSATVARSAVEQAWPQLGRLTRVSVVRDAGGRRATSLTLVGTAGSVTVSADDVRTRFGLRSTWFALSAG